MIETEQTIPERKDNPAHSSKIRNNSMNGFKNDMDDEKSLKGKGATEHSNKTPEMQPEMQPECFLAMQINNNAKTYSLITQLNHGCE
ncbi:hypothetical protein ACJGZ9_004252 [Escherichia coli]|nr:hypothetical protein [Escherichia coli]